MTDEQNGITAGDVDETAEAVAPTEVVPSLMLVMGDVAVPPLELNRFDAAYPAGYFVQAQVPPSETKVRRGARSMRVEEVKSVGGGNRAQRRHKQTPEMVQVVDWDEDAFFLNKCREQITGFRLLGVDPKTGAQAVVLFNPANNEDVYRRWLHPKNANFRDLLEEYLDWVAGRDDGELDAQFEILGNA
jgi:hypothetical protein